jgi:hypothetical protein
LRPRKPAGSPPQNLFVLYLLEQRPARVAAKMASR